MNRVLPSLLAASPGQRERQVDILKKSGIKYLHIDMMDGIYVPKYAFPIDELEHIQKCTDFLLDVHIMTTNPEAMAVKVAQLGVDTVSLHYEACKEPQKFLERVKCFGVHTGIVLNPETPVAMLNSDLLDICDTIQLMSVEPGIAGQTFIRHTLTRIQQICEIVKTKKKTINIQVDGDINFYNIQNVLAAGADSVVIGTALFNGDLLKNISEFSMLLARNKVEVQK